MKVKKLVTSITIDPALKKRLDRLAANEVRSFSSLLEKIAKDYIESLSKKEAA